MNADVLDLGDRPVIVGGGVAGLMTALELAPQPVVLLSAAPLGSHSSSELAQGGLAASLGADDSPGLHFADTITAGDGLCDAAVVRRFVEAAPIVIARLERLGVPFDRALDGTLRLGLEAAHSRNRIVHAAGDATGRELVQTLVATVHGTASITVIEGVAARRLLVEGGCVVGILAARKDDAVVLPTWRVVLATGGIGGLFLDSTNPLGSFGHGLALAARVGAELADLEFVQFHPTALDTSRRPMHLISEAVRGEGAILVDETGRHFLADMPGAELAPRDVVARGVFRHLAKGHRVFLDARERPGRDFADRFPTIAAMCRDAGIDPAADLIPVRPAAHYHMGGIAVDAEGRSTVTGLWACGEVAATGLHGANRLASNSLTEAVVAAAWIARSVAAFPIGQAPRPLVNSLPPRPDPSLVRHILSPAMGVLRHAESLHQAAASLLPLARGAGASADPAAVGLMMAVSAMRRQESRGAHSRLDFPAADTFAHRSRLTLAEALDAAAALDAAPFARSA